MLHERRAEEIAMAEKRVSDTFVLLFAPEAWPWVTKFRHFSGPPFTHLRELEPVMHLTPGG
jgi:hypothetical protein